MKDKRSLLIFTAILLLPALARGEGNLHVGRLEVHPYLSLSEKYSSNIYASSTDEKSDYITTTIPGIKLQFPFRMHRLGLEYNAVISNYSENTAENTTDQNAKAFMDFKFGSLFGLKLSDAYLKGHDPRGTSSTGRIEKFETNTVAALASYQLADISMIQVDYSKSGWKFETSDFRDRNEDLVSTYLYYRFLPKTSAFLEYDYKIVDYSQSTGNLDNKVNSVLFGLTWDMTERSKGTVRGGYSWKKYDQSGNEDFETWAASINITHEITDYDSLKLVGMRTVNEGTLQLTRYYVTTGAHAEYEHRFGHKLSSFVHSAYGEDKYSNAIAPDTTIRGDISLSGGLGAKYLIREWLEVAVDYNYRQRDSNIDLNDYKENSFMAGVNLSI